MEKSFMGDITFKRLLSILRRPQKKLKLFHPVRIYDKNMKLKREITEVDIQNKNPFNKEEY